MNTKHFMDHEFTFAQTAQSAEIINEVFSDNYHVLQAHKEGKLDFPDGAVILDLGANEGMFSILLATLFPNTRVIAFEPIPRTFLTLIWNVGNNKCDNIECHCMGVGKEPGELRFNVNRDGKSGGSSAWDTPNEGHTQVFGQVTTLDRIFEKCLIERCHLMKMDIEGGEYDALYNTSVMDRVDNMVAEFHINQRLEYDSRRVEAILSWTKNRTNLLSVNICKMAE